MKLSVHFFIYSALLISHVWCLIKSARNQLRFHPYRRVSTKRPKSNQENKLYGRTKFNCKVHKQRLRPVDIEMKSQNSKDKSSDILMQSQNSKDMPPDVEMESQNSVKMSY